MAKIFYADTSKVCIVEGGTNSSDYINTPTDHLGSVNFHSDLDYMRVITSQNVSVSLPTITASNPSNSKGGGTVTTIVAGSKDYLLYSHSVSPIPFLLAEQNGVGIGTAGLSTIQTSTTGWYYRRSFTLYVTSTGVYLRDNWFGYLTNVPAVTVSLTIHLLELSA